MNTLTSTAAIALAPQRSRPYGNDQPNGGNRYQLRSAAEMAATPPLKWLVRGVLPAHGLAAMFGPSGSGKSFLAIDLCATVAEGHDWFGFQVTKAPVAYIALEGQGGIPQRMQAWQTARKRAFPEMHFITQAIDVRTPAQVKALADSLLAAGFCDGLVIIDTLNRAAPGADENSGKDMGDIIAGLAQLREHLGGVVLAIHHTGKSAGAGLRGHSSLIAALDAAIAVDGGQRDRAWSTSRAMNGKSKDGAEIEPQGFQLATVDLGRFDGHALASCVVTPAATSAKRAGTLKPQGGNQRVAFDTITSMLKSAPTARPDDAPESLPVGAAWVRREDALSRVKGSFADKGRKASERASDAITRLQVRGLICIDGGYLWATGNPENVPKTGNSENHHPENPAQPYRVRAGTGNGKSDWRD